MKHSTQNLSVHGLLMLLQVLWSEDVTYVNDTSRFWQDVSETFTQQYSEKCERHSRITEDQGEPAHYNKIEGFIFTNKVQK